MPKVTHTGSRQTPPRAHRLLLPPSLGASVQFVVSLSTLPQTRPGAPLLCPLTSDLRLSSSYCLFWAVTAVHLSVLRVLGTGEGSVFSLQLSAQHKAGTAGNCLWSKHTHGYSGMPGARTLRALNPGWHLGQVMGGGDAMITKSQATLRGPQCFSMLCTLRSHS